MFSLQSASQVNWGIIGCGQIAFDKALPALLAVADARLIGVADPVEARRALFVSAAPDVRASAVRAFADYRELLADAQIDAVYVSLPTGMHAEAVLAAAAAGKAILCEKPLGRSGDECRAMIRAAQAHGVPLMTAYMSRFGDTFQAAASLLQRGAIGRVNFVYANFSYPALGPYPPGAPGGWRWTDPQGGGPLLDIGVYLAFGLREMLGERIARVGSMACNTVAPVGLPNPDTQVAWFQSESGIPGVFAATFSHAESRLIFYGSEGRLELSACFSQSPTGTLICRGRENVELSTGGADTLPHFENYRREFAHFTGALRTGSAFRPAPLDVLTDALLLDALRAVGETHIPTADDYLAQRDDNGDVAPGGQGDAGAAPGDPDDMDTAPGDERSFGQRTRR